MTTDPTTPRPPAAERCHAWIYTTDAPHGKRCPRFAKGDRPMDSLRLGTIEVAACAIHLRSKHNPLLSENV